GALSAAAPPRAGPHAVRRAAVSVCRSRGPAVPDRRQRSAAAAMGRHGAAGELSVAGSDPGARHPDVRTARSQLQHQPRHHAADWFGVRLHALPVPGALGEPADGRGRRPARDRQLLLRRPRSANLDIAIRPRRGVVLFLDGEWNRIDLPQGSFTTRLYRTVLETQFSPWVSLSNNVQYD